MSRPTLTLASYIYMWSFLAEFTRPKEGAIQVIVMDEEHREQPRPYRVHPRQVLALVVAGMVGVAVLLLCLVIFTPLRQWIPGYGTEALRQEARMASMRLAALQDSLDAHQEYMRHLRDLMTGEGVEEGIRAQQVVTASGELIEAAPQGISEDWEDHEQPALPLAQLPLVPTPTVPAHLQAVEERYLASLQLPAVPPVKGFLTGAFDPRTGHFAIDLAVEEGTMVRSIGDGYIILADWTHEGGYTIAVQHTDGFVSVYKHNERLLKRVGDRVRTREALAMSGNSGELTTGPHLHFELWHNGLAQNPAMYLVGL